VKIAMIGQKGIAPHAGGVERHVEEIGARLAARGHAVDVFCRARYTDVRGTHRGMRVVMRPAIHTKHLDALSHAVASTFSVLGRGYDVVHYHALGPTTLAPVARLTRAAVVSTCHGLDWKREKWGPAARTMLRAAEWPTARFPHRLITVSRALADHFRARYGVAAVPIPNGFDPPARLAPPDAIRERWGLTGEDEGGAYVLFLARLVPEKGAHLLIEAFRRVPTSLRLVIAGGASHSETYADRLRDLAAGDARVLFTGSVAGAEWSELLSNARLFVLPSTLEGMPLSLLEAMGHARGCLVSDLPENLEVAEPDAGGARFARTFRSGDEADLARALGDALADPEGTAALGLAARAMVGERFTWDAVAARVEAVYNEAARREAVAR
jgi:glycosyltransferase involved in cell wall biosynthesis